MDFWVQKAKYKMVNAQRKELKREKQKMNRCNMVIQRLSGNIEHMKRELVRLNGAKELLAIEIAKICQKTIHSIKYKENLMNKLEIVEIRANDVTQIISDMQNELKMTKDSNQEAKANIESGKRLIKSVY